jgi:hypothetical protein
VDEFALTFHGYVRITWNVWLHLHALKANITNIARIGSRAGPTEFTIGGSVSIVLRNFTKIMADIGVPLGEGDQSWIGCNRPFQPQCRVGDA